MKKISLLTISVILALGLNAQDTIFYHGYEDGMEPGPHGSIWTAGGATWTTSTVTDDASNANTGSCYFFAEVDGNSPNVWDNQTVFENIPVEDSTSYRLSLWVKNEESTNDTASINITSGDYDYADIQAKYETQTSDQWQRFHLMVYITSGDSLGGKADTIRFPIHHPVNGTYYLDDVTILESTIAGIRYNKNRVAVDFGYSIDPVLKLDDPSSFTVTDGDQTVDIDSVTMTIVQNDDTTYIEPYVYLNLSSEIEDGADVSVSYNGEENLIYSAYSPVTEDFKAAAFSGEVAVHDPGLTPLSGNNNSTSVHEINSEQIRLYPNPVQDQLHISSDEYISAVSILDITGKVIIQNQYQSNIRSAVQLNVDALSKGLFIVRVEHEDGKVSAAKILK